MCVAVGKVANVRGEAGKEGGLVGSGQSAEILLCRNGGAYRYSTMMALHGLMLVFAGVEAGAEAQKSAMSRVPKFIITPT